MSINKVLISGNLTRDAELRTTQSGMGVLSFSVAVNDRKKNNTTGEWENYPNFIECTMFGNRANGVSGYLLKGTKVAIEGRLRYSSWETDGQKRSKIEVIVDELEFMSRKADDGAQGSFGGYNAAPATANVYASPAPAPAAPSVAAVAGAGSSVAAVAGAGASQSAQPGAGASQPAASSQPAVTQPAASLQSAPDPTMSSVGAPDVNAAVYDEDVPFTF